MRPAPRLARLLAAAALGALVALPCVAQAPPLHLSLEVNAKNTVRGERAAAESIARQVVTHLIPQFEAQGWKVTRVFSARKAARNESCHAAVRVDLDAEAVFHLHEARVYEDDRGRALIAEYSKSSRAWGDWVLWDGMEGEVVTEGEILPVEPQLQSAGAGRPELDDEPSIARLVADETGKTLLEALQYTRAAQP